MHNELAIRTPHGDFSAFLQLGFYENISCRRFHNHNYVEVHLVLDGSSVLMIGDEKYEIKSGEMLVIPKRALHACVSQDETTLHTAFQINYSTKNDITRAEVIPVEEDTVRRFFAEIKECRKTEDYTLISAYISLFCCRFFKDGRLESNELTNHGFTIHEFFANRYNEDVTLADLAQVLHLSERQAERLVIEYMGKTFRKTLSSTRVMIAKQLLRSSDMSLSEIAEYVGYRSYAGFWKAMKKDG